MRINFLPKLLPYAFLIYVVDIVDIVDILSSVVPVCLKLMKNKDFFTFIVPPKRKLLSTYISVDNVDKYVDNVDNLYSKQVFAHFYYVSGSHSYQHFTVDTVL